MRATAPLQRSPIPPLSTTAALAGTFTMISAALAMWMLGFGGPALTAIACLGWFAVRHRQAWVIVIPGFFAFFFRWHGDTSLANLAGEAVAVSSLTLLSRSRAFRSEPDKASQSFLAACCGWGTCFALLAALRAVERPFPARGAPILMVCASLALAFRLFVLRRRQSSSADPAVGAGRAYWKGFLALPGSIVLLIVLSMIGALPWMGANSGSAAPGAWQPR